MNWLKQIHCVKLWFGLVQTCVLSSQYLYSDDSKNVLQLDKASVFVCGILTYSSKPPNHYTILPFRDFELLLILQNLHLTSLIYTNSPCYYTWKGICALLYIYQLKV